MKKKLGSFLLGLLSLAAAPAGAQSLMENLGRGVVAIRQSPTDVFVGWRLLGTDPVDTAFNLYRSSGGGPPVRLNGAPLTETTSFVDSSADPTLSQSYSVRPIVFGLEQAPSAPFVVAAGAPAQPYLRVPLQVPPGGTTPVGEAYTYSANDGSVGDLDGDGEYEIVLKWDPSNAKDNSQAGYTGNVYLDAYELDGTRLWRIDLGRNIRAGAHYTQFQVYDLDGDGRAEVACKTADGTVDGAGTVIGNPAADFRNADGYVLGGPEFLTVFDGRTGAALATTPYVVPRGTVGDWGDTYGNRVDRFLAGIAYLDGHRPSLITARGYYTRTVLAAWNWRDGSLTNVWTFDTGHTGTPNEFATWRGQGNHQLSIGDVDGDGRDEIMYGACAVDDDGRGLFTTRLGHGDALHMSDMDPDRPGLEVFEPHEDPGQYGPNALEFRDARTGALIFGVQGTGDIGRGLALDVDPRYRGYEMWGAGPTGGMYTAQQKTPNATLGPRGVEISPTKPSINFGIWWDGDLLRELLDGTTISKWSWTTGTATAVLAPTGLASNNGTKATPVLSADVLGDWREEVIWREADNTALRVYTTTIPTAFRFYTLMHDRQYREAIAWQNTAYNQPPHPSFFLGDGMAPPPTPDIVTSLSTLLGPPAPAFTSVTDDTGAAPDDFLTSDPTLVIGGTATPGTTVTVLRFGVGVVGSVPADAGGHWSFDYSATPLPDGASRFTATATDAAARTGPSSLPFTITVDQSAPAAPVIGFVSDEGTLAVQGTAEPGSTVEVERTGAGTVGTAVADAAGLWRADLAGPVGPPGVYSFTATATDRAGNRSAVSAAAAVDTTVATPSILAISDDTGASPSDGVTADNTLTLSGTAAAGDGVALTLGGAPIGGTTAAGDGSWSFDHTGAVLADGLHSFRAFASHGGGSSPASAAFLATVDTVAPAVSSVNRLNPVSASSSAAEITFRVAFSEGVGGVDASDFTPVFTGGLSGVVSGLASPGPATADVTLSLTGEGSVRLDVNAAGTGIADLAGHELAAGFTAGQTYSRLLVGNGTWIRSSTGGLWSDNPNWQDGIIGGASGNTANFGTIEIEGTNTVSLDTPRTVGGLLFGDTDIASSGSWVIDDGGDAGRVLTLAAPAGSPALTVNALGVGASATLAVPLGGTLGLTKLGPGLLVLARPNTLSGTVNVNGGTVRLPAGATLNTGAGAVNIGVTAGAQIQVSGGSLSAGGVATLGAGGQPGVLLLDSGSVTTALLRTNTDFANTIRVNGGTLTSTEIQVRRNSAGAVDFNSGFIVAGGAASVGTIGLGLSNSNGAMTVSGGSLLATGTVTIGNQVTAGRGGAMRVLGGTFTSTDTVNGIVLARTSGANANNVASATFTGGVSTAEKLTLGFDATVTAGSATVTLNGGALYLGAGGIVRNGTGTFATTLSFGSGILGATADWSTVVPLTLPAGGNVALSAADAAEAPHDISLPGVLSGAGGFTKTGGGTLALAGISTFTGPVAVQAGVLRVDGSLAAGAAVAVNGGALSGSGALGRDVSLNAGGTLAPGGAAPGSMLSAQSLTWNGGGRLAVDLASGRQLALAGSLAKGTSGLFEAALSASAPLSVGTAYPLASYAATDFLPADLTDSGLAGYLGVFLVGPSQLQFLVTGAGPTAQYTHWAYLQLPEGQRGAADDPDGDGLPNLLEFALDLDPVNVNGDGIRPTTVTEGGAVYPGVVYVRRQDRGGVTVEARVSTRLDFATLLDAVEVSATPRGDGTEEVVVRSTVPLSAQVRQFFRLAAILPEDPAPVSVLSPRVGVVSGRLARGQTGLALPLIAEDVFVGVVESNDAATLTFPAAAGDVGARLAPEGRYYVEVLNGAFEGERLDVDVAATSGGAVALSLGSGSFSTTPALAHGALVGARCAIRPHLTLAGLQALLSPGLVGRDNPLLADGVLLLEREALAAYFLRADGATWSRLGGSGDFRHKVIPPDASFVVDVKSAAQSWAQPGRVRANAFRKNLVAGFQSFATGFPVDLSPAQARAFVDPGAPAATRWKGNNLVLLADQIELLFRPGRPLDVFFLRGDGVTWRPLGGSGNVANDPILGATGMALVRRANPDPAYKVPLPFVP